LVRVAEDRMLLYRGPSLRGPIATYRSTNGSRWPVSLRSALTRPWLNERLRLPTTPSEKPIRQTVHRRSGVIPHELELRCPRGHLCVYGDQNGSGEWLVESARQDLVSEATGNELHYWPQQRRRRRRGGVSSASFMEGPDSVSKDYVPPRYGEYIASSGTTVVIDCPDCRDRFYVKLGATS
jgi:hypothetical protein